MKRILCWFGLHWFECVDNAWPQGRRYRCTRCGKADQIGFMRSPLPDPERLQIVTCAAPHDGGPTWFETLH